MTTRTSCVTLLSITLLTPLLSALSTHGASAPPNIVLILADDLGIECLSSYGGKSNHTPHLDKLASQSMQFTRAFSQPYCSPSRATLLSGRYPFQNGITRVIYDSQKHADTFMSPDQPSFARQLKKVGYTTAIAGKWQISLLNNHNTITAFGFDQYQCWKIFIEGDTKSTRFHEPYFIRNGKVIDASIKDRYGPDVNVDFLIDFMAANTKAKTPFMAYYTCLLPHFPWVPTPDSKEQDYRPPDARHKGNPQYFKDMVTYMDKCVGRIMQSVDDLGITDNTVFIFMADNGTDIDISNTYMDNKRIKGGKGTLTDRGTRVPLIVRWPGRIEPGSICEDLIDFTDILPTLCDVSGAPPPEQSIQGQSFYPQLMGKKGNPRKWVYMQKDTSYHVRNHDYLLTDKGTLRPVVELWNDPAPPTQGAQPEKEEVARSQLKAVLDKLAP